VRPALLFALCFAVTALGQDDEARCKLELDDCLDTCTLKFGVSTRDDERAKLVKCNRACTKGQRLCLERNAEAKALALEGTRADAGIEREEKKDKPKAGSGAKAARLDDAFGTQAEKTDEKNRKQPRSDEWQ
jgi:hypothetical protein